jgi:hypothetical protein
VPLDALGEGMSWGEACLLLRALLADPSSHLAAALAGLACPVSHETAVLADLWDLLAAAHTSKGKPPTYPRPWRPKRRGTPVLTRPRVFDDAQTREILARFGPERPEGDAASG